MMGSQTRFRLTFLPARNKKPDLGSENGRFRLTIDDPDGCMGIGLKHAIRNSSLGRKRARLCRAHFRPQYKKARNDHIITDTGSNKVVLAAGRTELHTVVVLM